MYRGNKGFVALCDMDKEYCTLYSVQCTVYLNYKPLIVYRGNKGFVALGDMDKEYSVLST